MNRRQLAVSATGSNQQATISNINNIAMHQHYQSYGSNLPLHLLQEHPRNSSQVAACPAGRGGSAIPGGPAVPGGRTRQKYTIIVHRVLGLTNRARLVNLRHSSCLSMKVWQATTVGGRATSLATQTRSTVPPIRS